MSSAGVLDIEWRLQANLSRGHYYIEIVVMESARRHVLAELTAPQLAVQESQSEIGSTYLAARCAVEPLFLEPVMIHNPQTVGMPTRQET
jgi:hypothetical protein